MDSLSPEVLHKLSKLLLALYNILLANASGPVEFYTPELYGMDAQNNCLIDKSVMSR